MNTIRAQRPRVFRITKSPFQHFCGSSHRLLSLLVLCFFTLSLVFSAAGVRSVQAAVHALSTVPQPLAQGLEDLTVTKISSAGGTIQPGEIISYTITMTNNGTVPHTNLQVTDALPAGTSYMPMSTQVSFQNHPTHEDRFEAVAYNNSNGTAAWTSPWVDNEDLSAAGGMIYITPAPDGGRLRFNGSLYGAYIYRPIGLTGATGALLTFDYQTNGVLETSDHLDLQIFSGSSQIAYHPLDLILNPSGTFSLDLSPYLSNYNLRARFTYSGFTDGTGTASEYVEVDNFKVTYTTPNSTTINLVDGTPPNLVTTDDALSLPAGMTLTLTYDVYVNSPRTPSVREIANTVSISSDQMPVPVTASVSDTLQFAEISLVKTASPLMPTIGDLVTYTFTVTNTGTLPIHNLTVSDPLPGLTMFFCFDLALEPGAWATCTAMYMVTMDDVIFGSITNTAEAAASDPDEMPVYATGSNMLTTSLPPPPMIINDDVYTDYYNPVDLPNVTANDMAFGIGNSMAIGSIDFDPTAPGRQTDQTDAQGNHWAADPLTGIVTFTPFEGMLGIFSIPYGAEDLFGQQGWGTLSVTINNPPAPQAGDDTTNTAFNEPITLSNITDNDTASGEGNTILATTIDLNPGTPEHETQYSSANHTWEVIAGTADVRFTPAEDFTGQVTIPYSVEDELNQHDEANLTVTVNLPALPVARSDYASTTTNASVILADITANDSAYGTRNGFNRSTIDLDPASPGIQTSYTYFFETWTVDPSSGAVTFEPRPFMEGTFNRSYTVKDESGQQTSAVLYVTVTDPDAPTAVDDSAATTLDSPATFTHITANDTANGPDNLLLISSIDLNPDVDGDQASLTREGHTWAVTPDTDTITFTPAAGFSGTASIPYSISDLFAQHGTANLSVTVDASFALVSFDADPISEKVVSLQWTIENENGAASYRLLRAAVNDLAQAVEVTSLPADPLTMTYDYTDNTVPQDGQYWYWLVKVFVSGSGVTASPVSVTTTPDNFPIFLPLVCHPRP